MQERVFLHDGFDFDEYESYLIGNTAGLKKLQYAIGTAIRFGEEKAEIGELFSEAGDYIGVKCVDDSFFLAAEKSKDTSGCTKALFRTVVFSTIVLIPYVMGLNALFVYFKNLI